jgi:lambda family phage minor tail protein L
MITADIQLAAAGSLVEFYKIDLLPIGVNEQYYFHNGVNELGNDVTWQGQAYIRFPIEAEGFEQNGTGQQARPLLRVANVTGLLGALVAQNGDLVRAKFTRKRTFLKYLDAVNFAAGNAMADSNVHLPDEIWVIDRKATQTAMFVEWELASNLDLTGVVLPRRQCIQNVCTWQYRSAECSYAGAAVADINDAATADPLKDVCGKRLQSCQLRFGNNVLPYGGFPGVGLTR